MCSQIDSSLSSTSVGTKGKSLTCSSPKHPSHCPNSILLGETASFSYVVHMKSVFSYLRTYVPAESGVSYLHMCVKDAQNAYYYAQNFAWCITVVKTFFSSFAVFIKAACWWSQLRHWEQRKQEKKEKEMCPVWLALNPDLSALVRLLGNHISDEISYSHKHATLFRICSDTWCV